MRYQCWCYNCLKHIKDENDDNHLPVTAYTFIVCPDCGNKRCPKSTDHALQCTNSNEPGQEGSRYK
jgi:predicted metal-binding protein